MPFFATDRIAGPWDQELRVAYANFLQRREKLKVDACIARPLPFGLRRVRAA